MSKTAEEAQAHIAKAQKLLDQIDETATKTTNLDPGHVAMMQVCATVASVHVQIATMLHQTTPRRWVDDLELPAPIDCVVERP